MLDENALAAGHDYFALGGFDVEPGPDASLAYTIDTNGGERYTLRFRDLDDAATDLADVVPTSTTGSRGRTTRALLLHAARRRDAPVAGLAPHARHRRRRRRARVPGGRRPLLRRRRPHAQRPLRPDHVGVEGDDRGAGWSTPTTPDRRRRASSSRASRATSTTSSTTRRRGRRPVLRRSPTPTARTNFELVVAPVGDPGRAHWTTVAPAPRRRHARRRRRVRRPPRAVASAPTASSGSACCARRRRRRRRRPRDRDARAGVPRVARRQPRVRHDARSATATRRWSRRPSASTTTSATRTATLVKRQPVLGGYDPDAVQSRRGCGRPRPTAPRCRSRSCYRRDLRDRRLRARCCSTATAPTRSRSTRRSRASRCQLLDRGVVFAIAHVRGGGELGRAGTRTASSLHKTNTFTDFVACAEHLVAEGWTQPRPARRARRQRRRAADGRGRQPAARPVPRRSSPRCRSSTVVTTMLDASPAAHGHRVGGVGRPVDEPDVVRAA